MAASSANDIFAPVICPGFREDRFGVAGGRGLIQAAEVHSVFCIPRIPAAGSHPALLPGTLKYNGIGPPHSITWAIGYLAATCLAILLSGCEKKSPVIVAPLPTLSSIDLLNNDSGTKTHESWYVHAMGDKKVGHRHMQTFETEVRSQPKLLHFMTDDLEMPRFGSVFRQTLRVAVQTDLTGKVEVFEYRLASVRTTRRLVGLVVNDQLVISRFDGPSSNELGKTSQTWSETNAGPLAVEFALAHPPLKAGEQRKIDTWTPLVDKSGSLQLVARDVESVVVGEQGERSLMPVEVRVNRAADGSASRLNATYWVNPQGTTELITREILGQSTYLATRSEALRPNAKIDFDITQAASIPVQIPEKFAPDDLAARLLVEFPETMEPEAIPTIPQSAYQSRRAIKEEGIRGSQMELTVKMPAIAASGQWSRPTAVDIDPNRWVDWKDRVVSDFAELPDSVTTAERTEIAAALHEKVYHSLAKNELDQIIEPASKAAKTRSGDCTEHAMLLAALLRTHKIPARVAIGLIVDESRSSFVFHMWTEAWIDNQWIPWDATRPARIPSAYRIKLGDSSLAGDSDYSVIAPVLSFLGPSDRQPKIQILANSKF